MFREGLLVVVSGPSGTGKGTLLKLVRERNKNLSCSVSATTREPREGEVDGVNYFFKTISEFENMIENDELVEWVEYCDNYYGTPRKYVEEVTKQGYDVVLEIEVEGALNIKNKFPDSVSIFILPPSFDELKKRIVGRGTEDYDTIEKRLKKAKMELMYVDRYDYVIINSDVENAGNEINMILNSEKLKYKRNKDVLKHIGM